MGRWLTFGNAFPANKMILSNRRKSRASSCLCRRNISQLKACNVMLSQSPIVWNCSQLVIWNLLRRGPDNVLSGPAIQFFFLPSFEFCPAFYSQLPWKHFLYVHLLRRPNWAKQALPKVKELLLTPHTLLALYITKFLRRTFKPFFLAPKTIYYFFLSYFGSMSVLYGIAC